MKSIYTKFSGLSKQGAPLDLLATWRKTFDKASEREVALFQKTYCDKWATFNVPQMSLTAEGVVGKYHIRFMATLIGDESPTPLRRSDGFDVWTGEIPRVGHKFVMDAKQVRKLMMVYENPRLKEADKVKQIEKSFKAEVEDAYLGCKDTQDFILLTAMSNYGVAQFKPEINNPGGRAYEVDYNMPEENKLVSAFQWTDTNAQAGKVNPVLMLSEICSDLRNRGIEPGEIVMSQDVYHWMRMNYAVRLMVNGKDHVDQTVDKEKFSDLLSKNEVPAITIVTKKVAISKDGGRQLIEPWNHNFIAIKPAGSIAEIQPAIEDSELMEEENVDYMDAGNGIRIAKWRTGDSTNQVAAEYTQGSARMIPILTEVGAIVCMQVRGQEEKEVGGAPAANTVYTKKQYDTEALLSM